MRRWFAWDQQRDRPRPRCWIPRISTALNAGPVHAEPAPPRHVELLELQAIGPVALVGLLGRSRSGSRRRATPGGRCRLLLVARAARGGRDKHEVAPALLVVDRRDAMDHVTVPRTVSPACRPLPYRAAPSMPKSPTRPVHVL